MASDLRNQTRNTVKFILDNWALILVVLTSGLLLLWPTLRSAGGSLSVNDAVMLINREKAVVVDVCEADEYAAGHVAGAKHVPLAQLAARLPEVAKNKNTPVILVCQHGRRAATAAKMAQGLGYTKALSLTGGLASWRAAQMPVEKG
jgi:rhodanese-related sulfurtransferase